MCRTTYESLSIVRLHVDLDNSQRGSPTGLPSSATQAEQEARRLQDAIAAIASQGSSEQQLRTLIEECRTFLNAQPRSMVRIHDSSRTLLTIPLVFRAANVTPSDVVLVRSESDSPFPKAGLWYHENPDRAVGSREGRAGEAYPGIEGEA